MIPKREASAQVDAPAAAAPMRARVEKILVRMRAVSVIIFKNRTLNWHAFYTSSGMESARPQYSFELSVAWFSSFLVRRAVYTKCRDSSMPQFALASSVSTPIIKITALRRGEER